MDFLKNAFLPGVADRDARRRHTSEMYTRVPEIQKMERGKYSLILNCPNGQVSTLFITLIASFPQMKPIFTVRGPLQHPWIDKYRFVTGCENLNKWQRETSNLSDIVLEIKNILECGWNVEGFEPPPSVGGDELAGDNVETIGGGASEPVRETTDTSISTSTSAAATELNQFSPDIPTEFAKLKELTHEQLVRLLDDEVAFKLFVKSQEKAEQSSSDMNKMRQAMEKSSLATARANMAREGELTALHGEVGQLQDRLQIDVARYKAKLDQYTSEHTLSEAVLRKQLDDKANELDLLSEDMGEQFVTGAKPLTEFLKDYYELRVTFHSLCAKQAALPAQN
jgi:hypothetical protein